MPPSTRTYVAKVGTILLVLGCLSLTSCAPDEPVSDAKPTPTVTPLFASEEEALEAARATYEGFLRTSKIIVDEDGASSERIDEFATTEVADPEKRGFANLAAANERIIGEISLEEVLLQAYRPQAPGGLDVMSVYACVNVGDTDVVDEGGNSVVAADRPDKTAFEVTFDSYTPSATKLRLSSKVVWEGSGVC